MRDIDKARHLFAQAGLAFPAISNGLAADLRQHDEWLYSTRELPTSPYILRYFVEEAEGQQVDDYAILSHSGHGVNSYAIQYYLVLGRLHMFLHLGWGGAFMDADAAASMITECFSLADKVVAVAPNRLGSDDNLLIVGSDFYGSYWFGPQQKRHKAHCSLALKTEVPALSDAYADGATIDLQTMDMAGPAEILREVVLWLEESCRNSGTGRGSSDV